MRIRSIPALLTTLCLSGLLAGLAVGQDAPTNLKVFPKDTSREALVAEMRHFSFALDVRCSHCHARREDGERGLDYASDANPNKNKAREMLRMVATINNELLPNVPDRDDPPVVVTCKTCHRGTTKPRLLRQELLLAAHQNGGQAAVEKFNELKEDYGNVGAYDFREWETNTVAEQLVAEGNFADALIIYSMNAERFPESASVWYGIGDTQEKLGNVPGAIEAFEKSLALDERATRTTDRLEKLKAK